MNNLAASLLLDNLLSYLTSGEHSDCKVVFLHVLTTNQTAIRFYERRNFRVHACLPSYYAINNGPCDGFSYVLYINGGQPPFVVLYPFVKAFAEFVWVINANRLTISKLTIDRLTITINANRLTIKWLTIMTMK